MPPGISSARFFALTRYTLPTAFKGLRETLAAFPSTLFAGPAGWLAHSLLTGVSHRLRGPPPLSRPSAGREPACLSRPIYHRHTNNTRESAETLPRSPCPHGSRRTEPGKRDRACGVEGAAYWRGPPRAHRRSSPAPRAPASPAAGAQSQLGALGSPIFILSNPKLGGEHRRRA